MKTANQTKTQWSWLKSASLTVMALATAFTVAACGNSGGGGGAVPVDPGVVPAGPICNGCSGNVAFLASGLFQANDSRQLDIALEFFGDSSLMPTNVPNTGYIATGGRYRGEFVGQGILDVRGNLSLCGIPAGVYTLTTAQRGYWGNDGDGRSQQGLILQSNVGGVPFYVSFNTYIRPATPAALARDGRQFPFYLTGQVIIQRADAGPYNYCEVWAP